MLKKMMIALSALAFATPALAETPPRVLYMGVDEGRELLSNDTQAFERIFDQTGNFLQHNGIRLFEADDSDTSKSYQQALDEAFSLKRKRLDAVVTVSLRHVINHDRRKEKDRLVAIARIHDARTLEKIDTVRVKSPIAVIREGRCEEECRAILMRRHIREVLPEFKKKLSDKLFDLPAPAPGKIAKIKNSRKYTLTLKGFSPREIRHIEDRVARLEGTYDLSSLRSNPDRPAFWLERRKKAPAIRDDLSLVLSHLDLQARIVQTKTKITLIKVNPELAYLD